MVKIDRITHSSILVSNAQVFIRRFSSLRCLVTMDNLTFRLFLISHTMLPKNSLKPLLATSTPLLSIAIICLIFISGCQQEPVLDPSKMPTIDITSKSGFEMMLVPAGEFRMGGDEADAKPVHTVNVSPFAMDKYEVKQRFLHELEYQNASHFPDPDKPVEMIRWSEAVKFCNIRSEAEGLEPCYDLETFECDFRKSGYRLPTEAEWEYAARAGTETDYYFGDDEKKLKLYGLYADNAKKSTEVAGKYRPNAWGFYDMMGNVAEWCNDRYDPKFYVAGSRQDPKGGKEGKKRVLRGGSWKSTASGLKLYVRNSDLPGYDDACAGNDTYGFRCVRSLTADEILQLEEKNKILN